LLEPGGKRRLNIIVEYPKGPPWSIINCLTVLAREISVEKSPVAVEERWLSAEVLDFLMFAVLIF